MIIRCITSLIISSFVLLSSCYSWGLGLPLGKITLKVIDENGQAVEGASLGIGFERNTGWGTAKIPVNGITGKEGTFTGSAKTINYASFIVRKAGYYESQGVYRFKEEKAGRWQPWNPEITVVMRKIENPVPMYARDLHMTHPGVEIPVVGKEVGFDLTEYDWIDPYGNGKHADMIFKLTRRVSGEFDYDGTLTITFPERFDGIQVYKDDRKWGSAFKLPRFAPERDYGRKLVRTIECKDIGTLKSNFSDDNNYFFRVRSQEKDGKLWRAMYGKIQGDIKFYLTKKSATIDFRYFLNPDYTRNLEWNRTNLFEDLKSFEQVGSDY